MDNTANTEPQTAAENIPATNATPTAEQPAAGIVENRDVAEPPTAAPEPTAENRDFASAVNLEHAEPFRRTTRQYDLGDNRRLVDMRPSNGGLDIIPEAPGVNFGGLPTMGRDDAIRAALDLDGSDAERLALIRQIVETPVAANVRQIATATH